MVGEIVSASVTLGRKSVLAVPERAIYDLGEGPLVGVVRRGKTAVLHPVPGSKSARGSKFPASI